jgi:hypothetical protein
VKEVERESGKPVSFTLIEPPTAASVQATQYLQSRLQAVGMNVTLGQVQPSVENNDALAGS